MVLKFNCDWLLISSNINSLSLDWQDYDDSVFFKYRDLDRAYSGLKSFVGTQTLFTLSTQKLDILSLTLLLRAFKVSLTLVATILV